MARRKNSTKLIIFLVDQSQSNQQYFGFKLLPLQITKRFLLAVKKLQENNITFNIGNETFEYNSSYFSMISLGSAEQKLLINLFDITLEDINDGAIGIIPDAIADAYNQGIFSDDEYQLQYNDQSNQQEYQYEEDF